MVAPRPIDIVAGRAKTILSRIREGCFFKDLPDTVRKGILADADEIEANLGPYVAPDAFKCHETAVRMLIAFSNAFQDRAGDIAPEIQVALKQEEKLLSDYTTEGINLLIEEIRLNQDFGRK